ncbi:Dabb family protein [Haliangium ochraceum]|uniref:Stress responsive alpha-beta barrel domain protein n=1 Tax=Haliangium ochraceum (strain DSM 14365 / JCM 11303 / SMP-2) TaxID=502025 RepID=D0LM54_HALO1|nr:Dabb family protein [Haliangium ochraceum]ACY16760.1 Stress responsive alpha-beta barrel domain protein [Haliangium ochraceum DSM 14365]
MIERYVFIRLKKEHARERSLVIEEARRVLGVVPRIVTFSVGAPVDEHAEAAWDVSIRVRFASKYDIESYRTHPAHRRFVDDFLKPRLDVIKAWNFHIG